MSAVRAGNGAVLELGVSICYGRQESKARNEPGLGGSHAAASDFRFLSSVKRKGGVVDISSFSLGG